MSDSYAQLYGSGSLWVDKFQMIEVMRYCAELEQTVALLMILKL